MNEFEEVNRGRVPAEETRKFIQRTEGKFDNVETTMNQLNISVKLMQKDIESICDKLDQNTIEHKDIMVKIDRFIETADNRYAEKKMENIVSKILWSFGFLVVGAIAAAVFKLIFK